jgi:hypothetical protein
MPALPLEIKVTETESSRYYEGAVPIVEELVGKAGARLGAWLNAMYTSVTNQAGNTGTNNRQQVLKAGKEEI